MPYPHCLKNSYKQMMRRLSLPQTADILGIKWQPQPDKLRKQVYMMIIRAKGVISYLDNLLFPFKCI